VIEELALIHKLVDYLLGATDEDRPCSASTLLIDVTRNLAKVGSRCVFAEIGTVMRIELFEGGLRILR
jgi:hypothetical protein